MRARFVASLALAASCLLVAGCLGEAESQEGPVDEVKALFGENATVVENGERRWARIDAELEGRIAGGPWQEVNERHVWNATVDLQDAPLAPQPTGGGGQVVDLTMDPVTVEVRFPNGEELADRHVRWRLSPPGIDSSPVVVGEGPADEPLQMEVTEPGRYDVMADLRASAESEQAYAATSGCFCAMVYALWTVDGHVQPVRTENDPWSYEPETMADRFEVSLGGSGWPDAFARVELRDPGPANGTDVDLGFYTPDREPIRCEGDPEPGEGDPSEGEHELDPGLREEESFEVWVGAQVDGCGMVEEWYYRNRGPVPYRVQIAAGGR